MIVRASSAYKGAVSPETRLPEETSRASVPFQCDPQVPAFMDLWESHERSAEWRSLFRLEFNEHTVTRSSAALALMTELPPELAFVDTQLLRCYSDQLTSLPDDVRAQLSDPDLVVFLRARSVGGRGPVVKISTLTDKALRRGGRSPSPSSRDGDDGVGKGVDLEPSPSEVASVAPSDRPENPDLGFWLAMLNHTTQDQRDATFNRYSKSPDRSALRRLLDADYDPSGMNLFTRTLFNEGNVREWCKYNKEERKGAHHKEDKVATLRFPSSTDLESQADGYTRFRHRH
jgi:hypothetical protein